MNPTMGLLSQAVTLSEKMGYSTAINDHFSYVLAVIALTTLVSISLLSYMILAKFFSLASSTRLLTKVWMILRISLSALHKKFRTAYFCF